MKIDRLSLSLEKDLKKEFFSPIINSIWIPNRCFHTNERIDKMKIEANLYATLASYLPKQLENGSCVIDIADGATVEDVLQQLNIPIGQVKLIFVDGVHASRKSNLKDGSRLGIFPPVGGG